MVRLQQFDRKTLLYGCVATLALLAALTYTGIPLLLETSGSQTIPRRMRNFLLDFFFTSMVSVSTVNTVTLIVAFTIGYGISNNGSLADNGLDLVTISEWI